MTRRSAEGPKENVANVPKSHWKHFRNFYLDWLCCFCIQNKTKQQINVKCWYHWNRGSLICRCKIHTLLRQPGASSSCCPPWLWDLFSSLSGCVGLASIMQRIQADSFIVQLGGALSQAPLSSLLSHSGGALRWPWLRCHLQGRPPDCRHQGSTLADILWHWVGH